MDIDSARGRWRYSDDDEDGKSMRYKSKGLYDNRGQKRMYGYNVQAYSAKTISRGDLVEMLV